MFVELPPLLRGFVIVFAAFLVARIPLRLAAKPRETRPTPHAAPSGPLRGHSTKGSDRPNGAP